jgi:hypothetical protein
LIFLLYKRNAKRNDAFDNDQGNKILRVMYLNF